jgi:hypothetical protein
MPVSLGCGIRAYDKLCGACANRESRTKNSAGTGLVDSHLRSIFISHRVMTRPALRGLVAVLHRTSVVRETFRA